MRVVKRALQNPGLSVGAVPKRPDEGSKKGPPEPRIFQVREPPIPEIFASIPSFNTVYFHEKIT